MSRNTATVIGFVAVLLWSLLALLTAASGRVPPFQLSAMAFTIAGIVGLLNRLLHPARPVMSVITGQPAIVWLLGVGGLFGYHFFYFTALRNAPLVEASLIAYLWPLLIVMFSALLPGERLRAHHLVGALLGFTGAALIVTKGEGLTIQSDFALGYVAAFTGAVIWSSYSVLSRRFDQVPTDMVTGFCLVTAALSLICHLVLEQTLWPATLRQWLAVAGLGLGPVGLAFFVWDYGVKHGDIQVLGASSYVAPLLSTIILVALGHSDFSWIIAAACLLITGGAVVAAKDLLFAQGMCRRRKTSSKRQRRR